MGIFDGLLIMSDLDGTLLDSQKRVSAENIAAISRFQREGGRFTFATGRSLAAVAHLVDGFALNAPAVLSNGCMGYDFSSGEIVYLWDIGGDAPTLAEQAAQAFPDCGVEIHTARKAFVAQLNEYTIRHFETTKMELAMAAPGEVAPPWVKLCMTISPERMPALMEFLRGRCDYFLQLASPSFLEIQAKNTDKGAGAREICRRLGIGPQNLICVGDGTNDVEFLRAGRAFAPRGACKEVLAMNPRILPGNDEHCIAALIEILEREKTI